MSNVRSTLLYGMSFPLSPAIYTEGVGTLVPWSLLVCVALSLHKSLKIFCNTIS